MVACSQGFHIIVKVLLKKGADVYVQNMVWEVVIIIIVIVIKVVVVVVVVVEVVVIVLVSVNCWQLLHLLHLSISQSLSN